MSQPSHAAGVPLADHLQQLTETLAATHTQQDVLAAALQPAMTALGALAGAILLLDLETQILSVAAVQGEQAKTVWQEGPLSPETPAGDALLHKTPRYFEHAGALKAAYPHLEAQTGGIAAVATTVHPLLLEGQPIGVLILDFKDPHIFTAEEKRFLTSLASQCSVALSRAQLIARLQASEVSFRRLVEISPVGMGIGSLDGQLTQVNDAWLQLLGQTRAAFETGEINWQALTPPEYAEIEQRAFETVLTQGGAFSYDKEMLTPTGERVPFQATMARFDEHQVVGYALDLRPFQVQQRVLEQESARLEQLVQERTAALQAEQLASQAFVTFTEAASRARSVQDLARLAMRVLQEMLPNSGLAFYELEGDRWYARELTADLPPALQATLRAGLPLETPAFAEVVRTRAPVFIDGWNEQDHGIEHSDVFGQGALYPILQGEEIGAVLTIGLRGQSTWSEREHGVVLALGRSFSLLYDRIATAHQLQAQKAEMESRNRALEAFSTLTGVLDVRLDRYGLIRKMQEVVLSLLPPGYAAYWETEDGRWRLKVQVGDAGQPALQAALDAGFPVGGTPTLDTPMNTGEPYFVDVYDKHTDVDPGIVSHLNAVACLPISVRGKFIGILNLPLFHTRVWDATDRAVLISAVQSLILALEGAQSLAELTEQSSELEQSNQDLRSANEELEAFTYSASHDLRTPVRHVMGFAELAQKSLEKTPNDKAQQYLEVVKQGATRMTSLIDAMLLLSRSGRQEIHVQPVNLNILVTQARRDVAAEFGSHPVQWQIGELPTVQGDHSLLQQVMTNLLSNAVKYSGKRERSEVEVWSEESASEWMIRVRDNGVGFDPNYAQRLFGIFQRLHTEKDFKGTGVGLATLRRIVQKHGGQVFAESDGQTGATFGFTLPKHR